MAPKTRLATPEDADAIAHLYLQARLHAIPQIPPPAHPNDNVLGWMSTRIRKGEECWLTTNEDTITGMCLLEPGWLDQLYINPDFNNQGLGSLLVEKAKQSMPSGLQLWTFQSNTGAHRFYERHGFIAVEYTDGTDNEERSPDVRYEWRPNN